MKELNSDWEDVRRIAWGIRKRTLDTTVLQGEGYLCQACSAGEILAVLYGRLLHLGPSLAPKAPVPFRGTPGKTSDYQPGRLYHGAKAPDLDRFILSPCHYAEPLYAALVEIGRLAPEAMSLFNTDGNSLDLIGEEHSPGIEVCGGSFGQALAQAAGIAAARKQKGETGLVWVLMSDGEFQEGQTWETLLTAAFHNLDNLRVFVDVNNQQVDGKMEDVMAIEPFLDKVKAFGWSARRVDGHDVKALADGAREGTPGKPWMTLAYTSPIHGLEPLESRGANLHYVRFKERGESDRLLAHIERSRTDIGAA